MGQAYKEGVTSKEKVNQLHSVRDINVSARTYIHVYSLVPGFPLIFLTVYTSQMHPKPLQCTYLIRALIHCTAEF